MREHRRTLAGARRPEALQLTAADGVGSFGYAAVSGLDVRFCVAAWFCRLFALVEALERLSKLPMTTTTYHTHI